MTKSVTAQEMKDYDTYTIEKMGMPSMVLMEHAAFATLEILHTEDFNMEKTLCLCGPGNNGGDGFAIARLLFLRGIDVEILFIGKRKRCSAETEQQYAICENYGINIHDNDLSVIDHVEYTTVVDALFGIGLDREVVGKHEIVIHEINDLKKRGSAQILACDIPSGLNATTGEVMGIAITANMTVTFAYNKKGFENEESKTYTGDVVVMDIGIFSEEELAEIKPDKIEEPPLESNPDIGIVPFL